MTRVNENWKWIAINNLLKEKFDIYTEEYIGQITNVVLNITEQPMSQEEADAWQKEVGDNW